MQRRRCRVPLKLQSTVQLVYLYLSMWRKLREWMPLRRAEHVVLSRPARECVSVRGLYDSWQKKPSTMSREMRFIWRVLSPKLYRAIQQQLEQLSLHGAMLGWVPMCRIWLHRTQITRWLGHLCTRLGDLGGSRVFNQLERHSTRYEPGSHAKQPVSADWRRQ